MALRDSENAEDHPILSGDEVLRDKRTPCGRGGKGGRVRRAIRNATRSYNCLEREEIEKPSVHSSRTTPLKIWSHSKTLEGKDLTYWKKGRGGGKDNCTLMLV